jgi:hypothetical protein
VTGPPAAPAPVADPRLRWPIARAKPSAAARRACERLHIRTLGDFLECRRRTFLVQGGATSGVYERLASAVAGLLASEPLFGAEPTPQQLDLPIGELIQNARAERAFGKLGIRTVGDYLATPREQLLAQPGFDLKTYETVRQRLQVALARRSYSPTLLPERLLELRFEELGLPFELLKALRRAGWRNVGDLLRLPLEQLEGADGVGRDQVGRIRQALERVLRLGLDQAAQPLDGATFAALLQALDGALDEGQREWLHARIGLARAPAGRRELARARNLTAEQALLYEVGLRRLLHRRAGALLTRLESEALRELQAFDGVLRADRLAPGTLLHAAGKERGDADLALRLLTFCFRRRMHRYRDVVTTVPAVRVRAAEALLRRVAQPHSLPVALPQLEQELAAHALLLPRGLLLHLLRERLRLIVTIDPQRGELVERMPDSVAQRLEEILREVDHPLSSDDLLFHYRDRHRRSRKARLLEQLRGDGRFVQVGADLWSLRSRHLDELELAATEAERIQTHVLASGGRHRVAESIDTVGTSERTLYLVIDCLRRRPALRHLGGDVFCPAEARDSQTLSELRKAMRRAMGEIPLSRFLENQPEHQRRLVGRLLRDNRMFVEPAPDRIDLLSNYPFNDDRLARLWQVIDAFLEQRQGHARLGEVVGAVNAAGLGGDFFTQHLLQDLLRRYAMFELLPGGLVARPALGLGGWILQRAREAIRAAGQALSSEEVLAEVPELASFRDTLAALLPRDPLLQSQDGLRFQVV